MLVERRTLIKVTEVIKKLYGNKFNITTQYKMLKLKKALEDDKSIYQELFFSNLGDFLEKNEDGSFKGNGTNGYVIKDECFGEVAGKIAEIMGMKIQVPDIYFSIDELEELGLTMEEFEAFMDFIK